MAKQKITTDKEQLLADFKTLVADTEQLLQHTTELGSDKADALRGQISASLQRARDVLGTTEQALLERGKEALSDGEEYVRKHPFQSLAIGAGIGFLLGFLISRR